MNRGGKDGTVCVAINVGKTLNLKPQISIEMILLTFFCS